MSIQEVAVMAAMWIATKTCDSRSVCVACGAKLSTYNARSCVQWKATDGEDLTDGNDDVAEEEQLHLSVDRQSRVLASRFFIRTSARQRPSFFGTAIAEMR
jgi:hypothetical protein